MADQNFTFEQGDDTYEFEHPLDRISTPRWLRANRRRDELDLAFTIIEECAGDLALDAVDRMTNDEFAEMSKALMRALGATLGE